MMEVVRFLIVSVAGVFIDVSTAYSVAMILDTPLWIAAAVGFVIAAGGNYILHEVWTFQGRAQRASRLRALQYLGVSLFTLLFRLAVVAWLSSWIDRDHALIILIGGSAVSFFVNYSVSKFIFFSNSIKEKGQS